MVISNPTFRMVGRNQKLCFLVNFHGVFTARSLQRRAVLPWQVPSFQLGTVTLAGWLVSVRDINRSTSGFPNALVYVDLYTCWHCTQMKAGPRAYAPTTCPSVRLWIWGRAYPGHVGRNSWKIISRVISLTLSLSVDTNMTDLLQRQHPQILAGIGVG